MSGPQLVVVAVGDRLPGAPREGRGASSSQAVRDQAGSVSTSRTAAGVVVHDAGKRLVRQLLRPVGRSGAPPVAVLARTAARGPLAHR